MGNCKLSQKNVLWWKGKIATCMKKEVEKMKVMMNNEWPNCCRWWLADTTGLQFVMNVSYCRGKPVTTNISILGILLELKR